MLESILSLELENLGSKYCSISSKYYNPNKSFRLLKISVSADVKGG